MHVFFRFRVTAPAGPAYEANRQVLFCSPKVPRKAAPLLCAAVGWCNRRVRAQRIDHGGLVGRVFVRDL